MRKLLLLLPLIFFSFHLFAQRQMEDLDRGVVAIRKSSTQLFVSWRLFATDPDDISFNVYRQIGSATPVKLNAQPITNSTNLQWTGSGLTTASRVFVKPVINGIEGEEGGSWDIPVNSSTHRIVQDFNFEPILNTTIKYAMKFCWPADLDGDGKYDFVIDRQNYGVTEESEEEVNDINYPNPYVEAYSHDGQFKWRINMGSNVKICSGHNDMVVAYDMDGDGKAEVLIKSSEGTTFADGTVILGANGQVTDYRKTNQSAPHYISIVNGETGIEIDRIEMPNKEYLEKADLSDDWNYKQLNGHFGIAYFDGINPSLVFEQKNRNKNKSFNYMITAWDFKNGKLVQRWNWVDTEKQYAEFHQIRVADVDGDGFDEMIEGSWVIDHDGTPLFNTDLKHGDRHRTADIDPDRPGLETFAIQQDNPNTLGMALYDAATGEMIKRWFQGAVGDVGRGECIAMDNTLRGLQMYSTMHGYYDCKGNLFADKSTLQPAEGIWWDGDLQSEVLQPIGKEGFNPAINKWNPSTQSFDRYLSLYYEKAAYYIKTEWGGRPAFIGDILGDWREELVIMRRDTSGFCVISNWDVTNSRLYCLMQNPGYRMQTTTKGYYQSPYTDYYLAHDMPAPPIAPVQKADNYFTSGSELTAAYANGKSVMFDLRNESTLISLNGNISPSRIWMINPKGKDYEFAGTGILTGDMDLIKSQLGDFTLNGNHTYTGVTRISEGKIILNGSLQGKVRVDAKGIIAGNAELKGGIELNEGLNYLGGRIEPGSGNAADKLGTITIQGNVEGKGRNCFAFDIVPESPMINDKLIINGDFNVTGNNNTIDILFSTEKPVAGTYELMNYTGETNATVDNFTVRGLTNTPYSLIIGENKVSVEIKATRDAQSVTWTGAEDSNWDFLSYNFKAGAEPLFFVPNDVVTFNDEATNKNVVLVESLPVGDISFNANSDYTISGSGAISGAGSLKKVGAGTLAIKNSNNTYTGDTEISGGIVEAVNAGNVGEASSLGAGSAIKIDDATLSFSGISATDRSISMDRNVILDLNGSSSSLMIASPISGENADFVKAGAGLINLQATNSFKSVTIKDGIIFLGSIEGSRYGLGRTTVTMEGGILRLLDINDNSNYHTSSFNMVVPEDKTAGLDGSSRWKMSGTLTGAGTLNLYIPYVRFDLNGNWSGFTGTINVTTTRALGADFRIGNTFGYGQATINLGQYMSLYSTSSSAQTIKIGALSGHSASYLSGNNVTWQVGAKNVESTTYNGVIGGSNSKLIKEGTGTFILTGENTYTEGTQVNGGMLLVNNTSGSGTGTGSVTVRSNAKLGGTGKIDGNVVVNANGAIFLQDAEIGELSVGKNVTLPANASVALDINPSTGQSDIINAANITLSGNLDLNIIGELPSVGKDFIIMNVTGSINGIFNAITPNLGDDYYWDQTRISEGILSLIYDPTSVLVDHEKLIAVFPTSIENEFFIDMGDYRGEIIIQIVSLEGKVCKHLEISADGQMKIDVSDYPSGVYMLKIEYDNNLFREKIIKK